VQYFAQLYDAEPDLSLSHRRTRLTQDTPSLRSYMLRRRQLGRASLAGHTVSSVSSHAIRSVPYWYCGRYVSHATVAEYGDQIPLATFLIAISWSDPEEVAAYKRVGLDDDPCCSTGKFIHADTAEDALSWGNAVATKYMEFLFQQKNYAPEDLDVYCWVEANPETSSWMHCLEFFQKVIIGQYPDFQRMTSEAYSEWCRKMGVT
jgi:hypothetical protein